MERLTPGRKSSESAADFGYDLWLRAAAVKLWRLKKRIKDDKIKAKTKKGTKMIPIEVRKKIIEARKNGLKIKEIVRAYGYGEATIERLLKR